MSGLREKQENIRKYADERKRSDVTPTTLLQTLDYIRDLRSEADRADLSYDPCGEEEERVEGLRLLAQEIENDMEERIGWAS